MDDTSTGDASTPDDPADGELVADDTRPGNRTRKWIIGIAIGVVGLLVLVIGVFVLYIVLRDSPDAFDTDDLSAAVAETSPADTSAVDASPTDTSPTDTSPTDTSPVDTSTVETSTPDTAPPDTVVETTPPEAATTEPEATASEGLDGTWTPTDASEFGYRVDEVLAGVNVTAVGRSDEIEGTLVIDGSTAEIDVTVQIENITSDDGRRDNQFRGRIMDADQFPEATFVSTEPIEFGSVPVEGETATATATGDLTLKGVTQTVTFEVTAETNGERIGVLGDIPILFEDYGIDNPSFGAVTTEDNGLLEFVLVFEPA